MNMIANEEISFVANGEVVEQKESDGQSEIGNNVTSMIVVNCNNILLYDLFLEIDRETITTISDLDTLRRR